MALDMKPIEDAILTRLNTLPQEFYDTEVPDGVTPPVSGTLVKPYGVVYFGGPVRTGTDRHLTSSRNDTNTGFCTVQIVAQRAGDVRSVADRVTDLMTGYIPPDAGEMTLAGSMGYSSARNETGPTMYYREIGFTYMCNLVWA
jgi:hypothetical protein